MHACSLHAIRVKQITLYSMFRNMYIATKRKIMIDAEWQSNTNIPKCIIYTAPGYMT